MAKRSKTIKRNNPFEFVDSKVAAKTAAPNIHVYGKNGKCVCDTDTMGFKTPENRSPNEIVVDASDGFIPLWAKGVTLRWRFNENSMQLFASPDEAKKNIRKLFGDALLEWGDAIPIKFSERHDAWDFEIEVREIDRCSANGCVLASAFFPDQGRHKLVIYPKFFEQSSKEQLETMCHEIGHTFGLRHFFAKIDEKAWPSKIFGKHSRFSIMNYGPNSRLTSRDKADLKKLYQSVWSGELEELNGTPIKQVKPFSSTVGELVVAELRFRQ